MIRNLLSLLADIYPGPRCGVCGERKRGWRTLMQHEWDEHPGERPSAPKQQPTSGSR